MDTPYIAWLRRRGVRLFRGGDTYWRIYNGGLVPASPSPSFIELSKAEAKSLLVESRAWFLRYSSDPTETETPWWYIAHDGTSVSGCSANTRSKINRGKRHCDVKLIDPEWLASRGYDIYRSAHERYKNATPLPREVFYRNVIESIGGPFEYWGAFVGEELAAYCQCIIEGNNVDTSVTRFHPAYLRFYSSYALMVALIDHYVVQGGRTLSNGDRSVAHDTNFQDFLLKIGFQRRFCRLNIAYQPVLSALIRTIFPLRNVIVALPPSKLLHKATAILYQEELRRQCSTLA